MREAKTSGKYMPTNLTEDLSDAYFVTNQRIRRTIGRLPDDEVRAAALTAVDGISAPSMMFHR
jgi:hypothetical protein